MKKILICFLLGTLLIIPLIALAEEVEGPSIGDILENALKAIWRILLAVSSIMFVVAGVLFATSAGDPEKVGKARNTAIYAVVAIMVGIIGFSLTTILQRFLISF